MDYQFIMDYGWQLLRFWWSSEWSVIGEKTEKARNGQRCLKRESVPTSPCTLSLVSLSPMLSLPLRARCSRARQAGLRAAVRTRGSREEGVDPSGRLRGADLSRRCCCCWRRIRSSRKRKTEFYWVYRNGVPPPWEGPEKKLKKQKKLTHWML